MKDYRYISADSHWSSAPQNWAERVPERFRDQLPLRIKLPNGGDAHQSPDGSVFYGGTSHFAGHGPRSLAVAHGHALVRQALHTARGP